MKHLRDSKSWSNGPDIPITLRLKLRWKRLDMLPSPMCQVVVAKSSVAGVATSASSSQADFGSSCPPLCDGHPYGFRLVA